jgi:arginase
VDVTLVQAPFFHGRPDLPYAQGPAKILEGGAAEALRRAGHHVEVVTVENGEPADGDPYPNEAGSSFEVVRGVAGRVHEAVERGSFPVALATNCLNSVGIVAGLRADVGVVWFDAHPDFSTPETSVHGFLDGMGLAILTGSGWEALRATVPGYRAVPEEHAVLVGARSADDDEEKRLAVSRVARVASEDIGPGLEAALDALRERVSDVYLHLDLDVLDRSVATVNIYAADGGPSHDEVAAAIRAIGKRFRIRAAALTAYDPSVDPDGRVPPLAVRFLEEIVAAAAGGKALAA